MVFTTKNKVEAWQDSQPSFSGLWASYFCALHSYQGKNGTKETQTHSSDHQTPTHLDVRLKNETEKRAIH